MLEGFSIGWLWKLMTWLPGFVLRRWWTKEALAARIRVDVRPRHSSVQISAGPEIPHADVWLELYNGGYFPVELDRMTVALNLAGVTLDLYLLDRVTIAADTRQDLHVHGFIPPGLVTHYGRNLRNGSMVSLSIYAEFNSSIHNFSVKVQQLSGIQPSNVNFPTG